MKGLKFTPTPKRNIPELKTNINDYTRKLRLIEFFATEDTPTDTESIARGKGSFNPPANRNRKLDAVVNYLKAQAFEEKPENSKNNLSKSDMKGLKELKENEKIVIKEADKGGCVVIMDTSHYVNMVMMQLNDKKTYQTTKNDCDTKVMKKLNDLVKKYEKVLTEKEAKFLSKFSFKTSNFYGLPKIHKSGKIAAAIEEQNSECIELLQPDDLKLRPIVAGPNCPTRPLSYMVDLLIKPLLLHVKSYIKDGIDFLNKCPRTRGATTRLATFDIKSLYTTIPHGYGLEAVRYWIENHRASINERFPTEFILEAIHLILTNNNFLFDDVFFHQLMGTAMGSIFAPTYAGLTVGYLELKAYSMVDLRWGRSLMIYVMEQWIRFLDDCHILLEEDKIKPEDLLEILNSINANIQFTMEVSKDELPFLDMLVKNGERIWMDLYHKPTDTERYVPFNSNHPPHCKRNIPFTLARRICMIVENEERKQDHLQKLRNNLESQKYPKNVIDIGIEKALKIPQADLRKAKKKNEDDKILPFVTTYNPNNPEIFNKIKDTFLSLQQNEVPGFDDMKLIQSRRQAPNLKRILTRAEFSRRKPMAQRCGKPRCECCKHIYASDHYVFKKCSYRFKLKSPMSCESSNLVYVIICSGCGEEYIGETGDGTTKLRDRVRVYRQHIKEQKYQMLKVEGHIRQCASGDFKIFPLLQIKNENTTFRREMEKKFQDRFKPSLN